MSVSASINKTTSVGGETFNQASAPSADAVIAHNVSVLPGDEGELTTRTDGNTGVITVDDSGHSFVQNDRVDVYWNGNCRRGMSVLSVSGALVTLDGGGGSNLPDQGSDITIVEPVALDLSVLGTLVKAILLQTAKLGQFVFCATGPTEHFQKELGEGKMWDWEDGNGTVNPITGDQIDIVYLSHGDTAAVIMKVGVLHDNA